MRGLVVVGLALLLVACSAAPIAVRPTPTPVPRPTVLPTPTPNPDVLAFPNGHTLRGAFREFWQRSGGAALWGSPLTAALWIDGRTVQYFERARFELDAAGEVRLGALGREALAMRRLPPPPAFAQLNCIFIEATQHNVCGALRVFWEQHGGADMLGAPLTEAEDLPGRGVQLFERARLEQLNDGAVQLADLGDEALAHLPAHAVLRWPGHLPASQRARLVAEPTTLEPFETAHATLETDPISGTATLFWGDTAGHFWAARTPVNNGRASVEHVARGALGPQGAVIMIDGRIAGVSTAVYALDATTTIVTGQPRFDELVPRVKAFMDQDISEYSFGDQLVRGYRSPDSNLLWLRDHVHQGKGYAYWEQDMTSLLDQFRRYQHPDGSFDDYLGVFEYGEVRGRKPVEADLEYLFVEGVYRAWQATGDDAWMRQQLAAMERGLAYATSDPLRWDPEHRLVKRPYTIDTWDFEIGEPTLSPDGKLAPRHWIDEQTRWSIFHGDNTGYAYAMELLARMYAHLGDGERAARWRAEAAGIRDRLEALAWNGRYYRHMVPLEPLELPVDTEAQLSLSNAYALNRDVLTAEQARAVLFEYQSRRRPPDQAFAEWYSIDPPFPEGVSSMPPGSKGRLPGEYVNGGIMPLVGGELAQGAFSYGFEAYGFDILQRYYSLIAGTGASYLWYYPLGQPGVSGSDTLSTDGWGASAMLAGLIEGAAGVQDRGTRFSNALLAPRWAAATDVEQAAVTVRYGASDGYLAYRWQRSPATVQLEWTGSGDTVELRLLLPVDAPVDFQVELNGQSTPVEVEARGDSRYVVIQAPPNGDLSLTW